MNITTIEKNACTGCAECVSVCPVQCITMRTDDEGFLFPNVDSGRCVECGQCVRQCPAHQGPVKHSPQRAYAFQRKDRSATRKSSSGGAAALLAEYVLGRQGVVYGCVLDEGMQVRHVRVTTEDDAARLRGSKYVQSDFSQVYKALKADCEAGKEVAVFGTPCQIAGVRNFLGQDYEKLLLVDLICHGVPNQRLFDQYLVWKVKKMGGGQMVSYLFRDKTNADWGTTYRATTITTTTTTTGPATLDPYYSAFIYAETYRESCYRCRYAELNRVGDITVGDYWGVKQEHPDLAELSKDGLSAVLVSTEKGQRYIDAISGEAMLVETTAAQIARHNTNLVQPSMRPSIRNEFYKQIEKHGFSWANQTMLSGKRFYINLVKYKMPAGIKQKLKRILNKV